MTEHHRSHECLMWGPHMHACCLHHRLWPPQSTSTISSSNRSLEHRHMHACTASPTTIADVARTRALPPQPPLATTRMRPSVYV
jgi:hypothetical protein